MPPASDRPTSEEKHPREEALLLVYAIVEATRAHGATWDACLRLVRRLRERVEARAGTI